MQTLLDGSTRIDQAIARLREFEPPEGYWLAFSGGKDSCVLKWLADRAGAKYEAHYSITSCDPPEVVRFIREQHPDVSRDKPPVTMWAGIVKWGYPTRCIRWCCRELKERGGVGRVVPTGVRWAESPRRKARHGVVSHWDKPRKTLVNPIVDWSDEDVWSCIRGEGIPYCSLYDEGWKRLGCVLCPQNRKVQEQLVRWPKMARAWRLAFQRLWESAPTSTMASVRALPTQWSSCEALWQAWLDRDSSLHGDIAEAPCDLFSGGGSE